MQTGYYVPRSAGGGLAQERSAWLKYQWDKTATGGMGQVNSALGSEQETLALDKTKGSGATSDDINKVKTEIAKSTKMQQLLESDSHHFTKAADTVKQTQALMAQMKTTDQSGNSLLQDINRTLKNLPTALSG